MGYWFRVPTLPKPIYEKLVEITKTFGVTQRGVVIAGVLALVRLGQTDPSAAKTLLEGVRKDHPDPRA